MRLRLALLLTALLATPAVAQDSSVFGAQLNNIPMTGDVSFVLRRPAYVAVFELIPGQGITQVYPYVGSQAREIVPAGTTLIDSYQVAFFRRASTWNSSWAVSRVSSAGGQVFRTYVLVASDKPLNIGSPLSTVGALRRVARWQPLSMNGISEQTFDALVEAVRPTSPGAIVETDAIEAVSRSPSAGSFSAFADEDGIDMVCFNGYGSEIITVPRTAFYTATRYCSNISMFGAVPTIPNRKFVPRAHGDSTACRDSARAGGGSLRAGPAAGQTAEGGSASGGIRAAPNGAVITDQAEIAQTMDALRRTAQRTEIVPGVSTGNGGAGEIVRADNRRVTIVESGRSGATPSERATWRGDAAAADRNRDDGAAAARARNSSPAQGASPAYTPPAHSPPAYTPPPSPVTERPMPAPVQTPAPVHAEPKRDIERKP